MTILHPDSNNSVYRDQSERSALSESVIIDVRTGERGDMPDWVGAFKHVWERPRDRLDRLLALLGNDVTLKAPTKPPVSKGKIEARAAFERVFRGLPDLRADILRWSADADADALFVEMMFEATIGGRLVSWNNLDRFSFENGLAVERVAYFDPTKIRKAYTRNIAAFRQYLRMR